MIGRMRWLALPAMVLVLAAGLGEGRAQAPPEGASVPVPTAEEVEKKAAEVAAAADLTEESRKRVTERLAAVTAGLERAGALRQEAERFRQAGDAAPDELQALQEELAALEVPRDPAEALTAEERRMSGGELKSLLDGGEADLQQIEARVAELRAAVAAEQARPTEIPAALERARKVFGETLVPPVPPDGETPVQLAERWYLAATKASAQAEVGKLEQERIVGPARLRVLEARLAVAERRKTITGARVLALRAVARERVEEMADSAAREAEEARKGGEVRETLAGEVAGFSRQLQQVAASIAEVRRKRVEVEGERKVLAEDLDLAERLAEAGGASAGAGQALVDQRRALPDPRAVERDILRQEEQLANARLDRIRIDRERIRQPGPEDGPEGDKLVETRRGLLEELSQQYDLLVREHVELDVARRAYLREVRELRRFLDEKQFWVPSSPVLGPEAFRQLPDAFLWAVGPARWPELAGAVRSLLARFPWFSAAVLLALAAWWWVKKTLRRSIADRTRLVRKLSTDAYRHTMLTFAMTVALSLPLPLVVWLIGRGLWSVSAASAWMQALALGLSESAPLLFGIRLARNVFLPDGLGEGHFRWRRSSVQALRRGILAIGLVQVPALILIRVFFAEDIEGLMHSGGRIVFLVVVLWTGWWLTRLFHPSGGVLRETLVRNSDGALASCRMFWFPLLVIAPVALAVLAVSGYFLTALELFQRLQATAAIFAGSVVAYEMLLRWFAIRERRLVVEKALADRKARREAGSGGGGSEEPGLPEGSVEGPDLLEVGAQTRRLLRALVGSVVLALLWLPWASAVPALRALDAEPFLGRATVADLLLAALIAGATLVVVRNLPGILEIALLRGWPRDGGARYALSSLVQYSVIGVGTVIALQTLSIDWSQFGWILAALSVGLGFGLQEVVANFVSGIVLLFERPIRVGDVVTVGGVTGTVSRIRIRATTITDWDRREFIVPNKEFITGQVLNWTLSNTVTRIVFPVGVAYGSDPERVRSLLRDILARHPDVLEDPPPLVNLESFGDSSLGFMIRCFLPALDRRLAVTHELHSEIHRRFLEEGIEIPFPQRDLHLRGGWGNEGLPPVPPSPG